MKFKEGMLRLWHDPSYMSGPVSKVFELFPLTVSQAFTMAFALFKLKRFIDRRVKPSSEAFGLDVWTMNVEATEGAWVPWADTNNGYSFETSLERRWQRESKTMDMMIHEMCPHCEQETEISLSGGACAHCGKWVKPCSACQPNSSNLGCAGCPSSDDLLDMTCKTCLSHQRIHRMGGYCAECANWIRPYETCLKMGAEPDNGADKSKKRCIDCLDGTCRFRRINQDLYRTKLDYPWLLKECFTAARCLVVDKFGAMDERLLSTLTTISARLMLGAGMIRTVQLTQDRGHITGVSEVIRFPVLYIPSAHSGMEGMYWIDADTTVTAEGLFHHPVISGRLEKDNPEVTNFLTIYNQPALTAMLHWFELLSKEEILAPLFAALPHYAPVPCELNEIREDCIGIMAVRDAGIMCDPFEKTAVPVRMVAGKK